jgi:hypothetical protein
VENIPISEEMASFTTAWNVSTVKLYRHLPPNPTPDGVTVGLQSAEWEEVIFRITDGSGLGIGLLYCEMLAELGGGGWEKGGGSWTRFVVIWYSGWVDFWVGMRGAASEFVAEKKEEFNCLSHYFSYTVYVLASKCSNKTVLCRE